MPSCISGKFNNNTLPMSSTYCIVKYFKIMGLKTSFLTKGKENITFYRIHSRKLLFLPFH